MKKLFGLPNFFILEKRMILRFIIFLFLFLSVSCSDSLKNPERVSSFSYSLEEMTPNPRITECSKIEALKDSPIWKHNREQNTVRLNGQGEEKWIKIRFTSRSKEMEEWYLAMKWTTLDFAEFCSSFYNMGIEGQFSGILIPYEKWSVHSFFPTFRFWQESNSESVYFLRLRSEAPLVVSFRSLAASFRSLAKELKQSLRGCL